MSLEHKITERISRRRVLKFWGVIGATTVAVLTIPASIDLARKAADERALAALSKTTESKKAHLAQESAATFKTGLTMGITSLALAALYKFHRMFERDAAIPVRIGDLAREDLYDPHPPSKLVEHLTSTDNPPFTPPGIRYRLPIAYSIDAEGRQN